MTDELWTELCELAELYLPGWAESGIFAADAFLYALEQEGQEAYELLLAGRELGWGKSRW